MVEVKRYSLHPTALIPNSPHPLLYYPGILSEECKESPNQAAMKCYGLYTQNGWQPQWIYRYGLTQTSHYHSQAHECMTILSGTSTIRFGVADTTDDMEENTNGRGMEKGGVEIEVKAGDVFIIPAGVAHKTYNTCPEAAFKLLTPGNGHAVETDNMEGALGGLELEGFTMMGAYPSGSNHWDFAKGGEHVGDFERVWSVSKPASDPVLGKAQAGIIGSWR
ncbi:hypothetical protein BJ170DRAFT_180048 [Xylariales sp. AK1849]|nr:hypothetical protein BJ170DRAFT_180048 [Xylariales sp. AK1849]